MGSPRRHVSRTRGRGASRADLCDGAIGTSLSPPQDHTSRPRKTVVRFLKRRLPDGTCEIEVLMVRPRSTDESNTQRSTTARTPANLSRIDPMSLPCGTEIVEIRDAGTDGSIGGVRGRGPTGECADEADRSPPMPAQMTDNLAALADSEFLLTIGEPSAWHHGQPPPMPSRCPFTRATWCRFLLATADSASLRGFPCRPPRRGRRATAGR